MKKLLFAVLVFVLCPALTIAGTMVGNTGETIEYKFQGHVLTAGGTDASAILYCPTEVDDPAFRAALAALTGAVVDYFDPRAATPDVALLSGYDVVFAWVNFAYLDNVAMGDNLAAYVDGGGKVILGQWCLPTAGNFLSGAIMTSAYCPVTGSSWTAGDYNGDGTDCIFDGVTTISTSYNDIATLVAGSSDGTMSHGGLAAAWRDDRMVYYSPGNTGVFYTVGDTAQLVTGMVDCGAGPLMPRLDLKVNGSSGPVTTIDNTGSFVIDMDFQARDGAGYNAEVYLLIQRAAGGWFSYDGSETSRHPFPSGWHYGRDYEYYAGPLMDLSETLDDLIVPVPAGDYTVYLVLDVNPDGVQNNVYDYDSVDVTVLPAGTQQILIWNPSGSSSGQAQADALNTLGFATVMETGALPTDLGAYVGVFVDLGIFGLGGVVLSAADGTTLAGYMDAGGPVYMEGGDTWAYDAPTAAHAYFGITGLSDGSSDTFGVTGYAGTFTDSMAFTYAGNNAWMDQLAPIAPAYAIFQETTALYVDAIANPDYGTIGASFEFGGLVDGGTTKLDLMAAYLAFMGL
jgi:hypothetical protein